MFTGPNIITNNLKLHFDPGNPISLSGNKIIGRSKNRIELQLINDANVENNQFFKSVSLDGTNSQLTFNEINIQPPWTSIIIFKTFKTTANTGFRQTLFGNTSTSRPGWNRLYSDISSGNSRTRLLTRYRNSSGTWTDFSSYIGPYVSSYVSPSLQNSFWVDNVIHLTTTVSSDKIYRIYINGVLRVSINRSSANDLDNGIRVNRIGVYSSASQPFGGNIYLSSLYDKELSSNEVFENFNAFSGRFI
jgi:hypothetical protein